MPFSLKEARKKAKLTQRQVAEGLNVTRCTVDNWERGRSYPGAISLKKLLALYNIKFEDVDFGERSGNNDRITKT